MSHFTSLSLFIEGLLCAVTILGALPEHLPERMERNDAWKSLSSVSGASRVLSTRHPAAALLLSPAGSRPLPGTQGRRPAAGQCPHPQGKTGWRRAGPGWVAAAWGPGRRESKAAMWAPLSSPGFKEVQTNSVPVPGGSSLLEAPACFSLLPPASRKASSAPEGPRLLATQGESRALPGRGKEGLPHRAWAGRGPISVEPPGRQPAAQRGGHAWLPSTSYVARPQGDAPEGFPQDGMRSM